MESQEIRKLENERQRGVRRTLIILAVVAAAFYFGFMVMLALK